MRIDEQGDLALRVAIADDHRPFADGLASWLAELGASVTGVVGSASELARLVDCDPPDVVTVDVAMPPDYGDEGIRFAEELEASHPSVGVLVVSSYREAAWAERLFECRQQGTGYLLKDSLDDTATLRDALRQVARGEIVADPKVMVDIAVRRRQRACGEVSRRELEVLREMAAGRSNGGIAAALFISERTVENHIRRVFDKLGLGEDPGGHARVRAVLWFQQQYGRWSG